jgi:crotonobetainyl-CoA:carnitine CoA-transferase CaiB-like acyl-CoA transferase
MAAAGGVAAALFARERTGRGQLVSTSLLRIGSYMVSWDLNIALRVGAPTVPMDRASAPNPLINCYTCADGKRVWLLGLEGDRHWPNLLRADDPRFADTFVRAANAAALITEMDAVFATKDRSAWTEIFDRADVWWQPVNAVHELVDDPQAHAAGCFVDTPLADGTTGATPSSPVSFAGGQITPAGPTPEFGQHTEEILLELGYDWDRIIELKDSGAVN